ncbi:TIGR02530 family flagellar biosynthesis protein [Clostridiaceae bacterium 35-E11]
MSKIFVNNNHLLPKTISKPPVKHIANERKSFAQVLDAITDSNGVKFSKHAIQRLEARNIQLNGTEMLRIKAGLDKANQKGIKETLILMDNKAFVASVPNKTIITAALDEQLKENVFTNIDGAVII